MIRYAQMDGSGECISVFEATGELDAPNLIRLADDADVQPGDIINGGVWTRPAPPPPPPPQPSPQEQIDKLKEQLDITNATVDFLLGI